MIIIRKAKVEDIPEIYKHIHLGYVKKYCHKHEEDEWEKHRKWYAFLINSPAYLLYTIEDMAGKFLGTVKFELHENEAVINIYLCEDIRGKGYSESVVKLSVEELKFEKPEIQKVIAYILEENEISIKIFSKTGFEYKGKKEYMGVKHLFYTKEI